MKAHSRRALAVLGVAMLISSSSLSHAQPPAQPGGGGRPGAPVIDPTKPAKLEIVEGSKARYKVREQLAGINFPSDAVGTTEAVTGGTTRSSWRSSSSAGEVHCRAHVAGSRGLPSSPDRHSSP